MEISELPNAAWERSLMNRILLIYFLFVSFFSSSNAARGYSVFGLAWSMGTIVGPILGGFLSNPYEKYPSIFGSIEFLKQNPYFLPCLLSASVSLIGFVLAYIYLNETNPKLIKTPTMITIAEYDESTVLLEDERVLNSDDSDVTMHNDDQSITDDSDVECEPKNMKSRFIGSASVLTIISYAILAFFSIIFYETFSIWMVTSVKDGNIL